MQITKWDMAARVLLRRRNVLTRDVCVVRLAMTRAPNDLLTRDITRAYAAPARPMLLKRKQPEFQSFFESI